VSGGGRPPAGRVIDSRRLRAYLDEHHRARQQRNAEAMRLVALAAARRSLRGVSRPA
jgi:hypothetical protein